MESPSVTKESQLRPGIWQGCPCWGSREATVWSCWSWSLDCLGDSKMLEMPELFDNSREELLTGSGTSPRERSVLQSTKLIEAGDLNAGQTIARKCRVWGWPDVFGLALVQYFLAMIPCLCLGMIMYILSHYMMGVCDLFLVWFYRVLQLRDCLNLRRDF